MTIVGRTFGEWVVIGRPGYAGEKKKIRRKELQRKFGKDNWQIAHLINDRLLSRTEALVHFEESYVSYFKENPEIFDWLILTAKDIYDNDESNVNSGLDYTIQEQNSVHLHDIAIRRAINRLGRKFQGNRLIEIRGQDSEGYLLTTGLVPFYKPELILKPQLKGWWEKDSIEAYWQSNKVIAVRKPILESLSDNIIVIVLRNDVKMGKGKFSTQAAHALVSLLQNQRKVWEFNENLPEIWVVDSEEKLLGIHSAAAKNKINSSLIRDAGKTQIAAGTITAAGFGPAKEISMDVLLHAFNAKPLEFSTRKYQKFTHLDLNV
jgi:peptidyl-tRNA hydrolase